MITKLGKEFAKHDHVIDELKAAKGVYVCGTCGQKMDIK